MNKEVSVFIKTLQKKKLTIAFAESITCGMASEKLATSPGTSDVLKGAVICYSPEVKKGVMKIPERIIERYTCESMEVTRLLAKKLPRVISADIYAALTGLASSGGSESKEKPVGTVFFCVKFKGKVYAERKLFRGSPLEIRTKACLGLYKMVLKIVKRKEK